MNPINCIVVRCLTPFSQYFSYITVASAPIHAFLEFFNPLPDMPILGSSSSTANKDMMSKIWTNGETSI